MAVELALRVAGLAVERFAGVLHRDFTDRRAVLAAGELHALAAERIVFALWMAHPVVRHEDAAQIGMPAEADAEEIVDLALREARPRIDAGDARHDRVILRYGDFQEDAPVLADRLPLLLVLHRVEIVDDLEPIVFAVVQIVYAEALGEEIVLQVGIVAHQAAYLDDILPLDHDPRIAPERVHIEEGVGELLADFLHFQPLGFRFGGGRRGGLLRHKSLLLTLIGFLGTRAVRSGLAPYGRARQVYRAGVLVAEAEGGPLGQHFR